MAVDFKKEKQPRTQQKTVRVPTPVLEYLQTRKPKDMTPSAAIVRILEDWMESEQTGRKKKSKFR